MVIMVMTLTEAASCVAFSVRQCMTLPSRRASSASACNDWPFWRPNGDEANWTTASMLLLRFSSFWASSAEVERSFEVKSSKASVALPMRPAALMRGPSRKPSACGSGRRLSRAASASAARPGFSRLVNLTRRWLAQHGVEAQVEDVVFFFKRASGIDR